MPTGRRRLVRDLNLEINGRPLKIDEGFVTDYSSWPRIVAFALGLFAIGLVWLGAPAWEITVSLILMMLAIGPRFSRTDVAGTTHDFLFQLGTWGVGGEKVSFIEANRTWQTVAMAGTYASARVGFFWGWAGRIGLFLVSWPVWIKYRMQD